MHRTFHIVTFGCQMNKLDSELLQAALQSRGFRPVADPEEAGVVLYNTCSVREQAENKVFSHLGTYRGRAGEDPEFILGVVGCMAQRMGEKISEKFPFTRLVCGTRSFLQVPDYLAHIAETGERVIALGEEPLEFDRDTELRPEGHHAYVSIMRGCDNYCAYCIVPHVRGHETSREPADVIEEARQLADGGVVELTLLGQNVNSYGKGLDADASLAGLLGKLDRIEGLRRIRFITSHPRDMSEEIFRAVADLQKVCEHVHMPAQSGADPVLHRMKRHYDRPHYMEMIEMGRTLVPDLAFSSDFIVGFPGETDEDFERTLCLLKRVRFQQSYIFRYSPRPGTRAAEMEDDVPDEVKRDRQQELLCAQEQIDTERRAAMVGETVEVLCAAENASHPEEGQWRGRTRENDIVVFSAPEASPGAVRNIRIHDSTALTLFGAEETAAENARTDAPTHGPTET